MDVYHHHHHQHPRFLQQSDRDDQSVSAEGSILTFVLFLVQVAVIYAILRACVVRCRDIQRGRSEQRANEFTFATIASNNQNSNHNFAVSERVGGTKIKAAIKVILDDYTVPFSRRTELFEKNEIVKEDFAMTARSRSNLSRHINNNEMADLEIGVSDVDANRRSSSHIHNDFFDEQSELVCPICLDEYEQEDQVCAKGCRHLYHRHCLEHWLHQKGHACPYCRKIMISDEEIALYT